MYCATYSGPYFYMNWTMRENEDHKNTCEDHGYQKPSIGNMYEPGHFPLEVIIPYEPGVNLLYPCRIGAFSVEGLQPWASNIDDPEGNPLIKCEWSSEHHTAFCEYRCWNSEWQEP